MSKKIIAFYVCALLLHSCENKDAPKDTDNLNLTSQNEAIHGAKVVKCFYPYKELGNKRVALLDYYESSKEWELQIDLDENKTVDQKVQLMLSRVAQHDPDRARLYADYYKTFAENVEFDKDPSGFQTGPLESIQLPGSDCGIYQASVHKHTTLHRDDKNIISLALWSMLDTNNQAMLIMHELIAREADSLKNDRLASIRYFNALIASNEVSKVSLEDYATLLETKIGLPAITSVAGIPLAMRSIQRENGITTGEIAIDRFNFHGVDFDRHEQDTTMTIDEQGIITFSFKKQSIPLSAQTPTCKVYNTDRAQFYPNGDVYALAYNHEIDLCATNGNEINKVTTIQIIGGTADQIYFSPIGIIQDGSYIVNNEKYAIFTPALVTKSGKKIHLKRDVVEQIVLEQGWLKADTSSLIFDLDQPTVFSNTLVREEDLTEITINHQREANSIFAALSNATLGRTEDGFLRSLETPRRSGIIYCKKWSANAKVSCKIRISNHLSNYLTSDVEIQHDAGCVRPYSNGNVAPSTGCDHISTEFNQLENETSAESMAVRTLMKLRLPVVEGDNRCNAYSVRQGEDHLYGNGFEICLGNSGSGRLGASIVLWKPLP